MAKSRRSRLMIDQWIAEDDHRERAPDSRNQSRDRRPRGSPPPARPETGSERGVRSTRKETDDIAFHSHRRERPRERGLHRRRGESRSRSASPHRRDRPDLYISHRSRDLDKDRISHSHSSRLNSPPSIKRRRTRSPSPLRGHQKGAKRGRSRTPDRFEDSTERISAQTERRLGAEVPSRPSARSRSRYRDSNDLVSDYRQGAKPRLRSKERRHSRSPLNDNRPPPRGPRPRSRSFGRRPISAREQTSRPSSPERGFYSSRASPSRHSSGRGKLLAQTGSRHPKDTSRRSPSRRSRSPHRPQRDIPTAPRSRRTSPLKGRLDSSRASSPIYRGPSSRTARRRPSRSPQSPSRPHGSGSRRRPRVESPGPLDRSGGRYMATRGSSRPPSPPRPIPSFSDIKGQDPIDVEAAMGEHYTGHGMNMHQTPRPPRPHVDTRQSFSNSPQYMTPNTSHHGSPHSQSPYSDGRGGWVAQQPAFSPQPG